MSSVPPPREDISGEDNPWGTGVVCDLYGCDGEILCWVETTKGGKAYYHYACTSCDDKGPWYVLGKRKKGRR